MTMLPKKASTRGASAGDCRTQHSSPAWAANLTPLETPWSYYLSIRCALYSKNISRAYPATRYFGATRSWVWSRTRKRLGLFARRKTGQQSKSVATFLSAPMVHLVESELLCLEKSIPARR
jgi:hypothetical protein